MTPITRSDEIVTKSHYDGLSAETADTTPLVPPVIAFAEAVVSKEVILGILRKHKESPLLEESPDDSPTTPVPQLVPWFERFSHLFEVLGETDIYVRVDTSKAPRMKLDLGACEYALRFVAIRMALEMAHQLENDADGSARFEILLLPGYNLCTCRRWRGGRFFDQIDMLISDVSRVFSNWLRGVQHLWVRGRFFPPSAHQRLELEHQLRALRTRLSNESPASPSLKPSLRRKRPPAARRRN